MSQQSAPNSSQSRSIQSTVAPSLTKVLGVVPVLPGESADLYQTSLDTLIAELGARSVMQVYLAEKIHECLWWMRRYEEQKRATLISGMAYLADPRGSSFTGPSTRSQVRSTFLANKVDNTTVRAVKDREHTIESLRQEAMAEKRGELLQLDQQIALQAKILAGLQSSYEVAFNRKTNVERLQLQTAMLRRDLEGIEVVAEELSTR
ncbi:MAG: hypothetical protein WCI01_09675 [Chlorobiaceae bacterium]